MMGEEMPFEVGAGRGADEIRACLGQLALRETRAVSCLGAEPPVRAFDLTVTGTPSFEFGIRSPNAPLRN
jgi:hypothetical protein